MKPQVVVDVAGIGLKTGDRYVVRDAEDFFGKPIVEGVWDGKSISIPMTGLTAAAPLGLPAPPHTAPAFGCFIIRNAADDAR
jgi:hypothetical protein